MAQQVTTDNSLEEWRIKYNQFVVEYSDFYSSITGVAGGIYVNRSGDSMSGKLTIDRTASNDALEIKTNAGVDGHLDFRRGSVFVSKISSKFYGTDINSSQVTSFSINTVEVARISASGLLGIGTDNPQRGIHLRGGVSSAIPSIRLERSSVRSYSIENSNDGDLTILDNTAGVTRLTMLGSNGYLGVNITNPARPLHVSGFVRSSSANSTGIGQFETFNELGNAQLQVRTCGSAVAGTLFGQSQANRSYIFAGSGSDTGLVVGTLGATPLHFGTSNATRMTITSSGSCGLGTTTPAVTLDVAGDINASSSLNVGFNRAADGSAVLDLQSQGGIGIDYNARLQRAAGVDGNLTLTNAGNGGLVIQNEGTGLLNIRTNNTSRMEFYSDGRIVIPGNNLRIATSRTIASSTATGSAGEIAWDDNYIYICVATNTWKRAALSTW